MPGLAHRLDGLASKVISILKTFLPELLGSAVPVKVQPALLPVIPPAELMLIVAALLSSRLPDQLPTTSVPTGALL